MFRPWGKLEWSLDLATVRQWHFIGCVGTEERSIAAVDRTSKKATVLNYKLLRIRQPNSPNAAAAEQKLIKRQGQLKRWKLKPEILDFQLLDPVIGLDPLVQFPKGASVVLDITSLPKRFFFYLLKRIFLSAPVSDLVLLYTSPNSYPEEALSGDEEDWEPLPTFRQPDLALEKIAHQRLIVNVGFLPDGLVAHFENPADEKQIDLIVPFPAPVQALKRSWQSVWALKSTAHSKARFSEHRVGANDISEAFNRILQLRPADTNMLSLAPFGPKPISAAMCLYASLTGSPVYYSQPKNYHPDYSIGVGDTYCYWIKHAGQSYYSL